MVKTLDRYIYREMTAPFILTTAVLLFVMLLQRLFKLTELIVAKGASLLATVKLLLYVIPNFLVITLPMSLLVAALTAFARMSSDSEVTAMKASCISLYRLTRPVFIYSVVVFVATAVTSLILVPAANTSLKAHVFNMLKQSAMVGIEPGIFSSTFNGMVIYVDKMSSPDSMEGVFISDERSAKEHYTIVAKRGKLIADPQSLKVTLALEDGTIHTLPSNAKTYNLMGFTAARLYLDINNTLAGKGGPGKSFEDTESSELLQQIRKARNEGQPTLAMETELHKRLSIPFACLIFGLIGAPLGIRRSRSGKSAGIAIALLVFLAYYIVLGGSTNLAETGTWPPLLAFWIPNFIMVLIAWLFVMKKGHEVNLRIWDSIVHYYYRTKERLLKKISRRNALGR